MSEKRTVVQLLHKLARGKAVDILWWEPSDEVLTLYIEGRLTSGGSTRASYTFDGAELRDASVTTALLHERMSAIVSPFAEREPAGSSSPSSSNP